MTTLTGFRLQRFELFNWGTFDKVVWPLVVDQQNVLVTGDIGSGKSTLIDAITTLLVPTQKVAYNKAAGAESKERTARSYVLGHYTSTRNELGTKAKPVALREPNRHSVILGVFASGAESVTLAQVFWCKEDGPPSRFYVVAPKELSIQSDFSGFGSDIRDLRKRLTKSGYAVEDTYPSYLVHFGPRFGLTTQAIELFHQTVSMKTVDNLSKFIREHMLESPDLETRIASMIQHFDDLARAHDLVKVAKAQIAVLTPLVETCHEYQAMELAQGERMRSRNALTAWMSTQKNQLIADRRLEYVQAIGRYNDRLLEIKDEVTQKSAQRDEVLGLIAKNGGDRLTQIEHEIETIGSQREQRDKTMANYRTWCGEADVPVPSSSEEFHATRSHLSQLHKAFEENDNGDQALQDSLAVERQAAEVARAAAQRELDSLRSRRSNIDSQKIDLRAWMCDSIQGITPDELPFVGELLQVPSSHSDWEPVIERVLRNFGLNMLVPDRHHRQIKSWVKVNRLRDQRLDFIHVRDERISSQRRVGESSLVRKLEIKGGPYRSWLDHRLRDAFDYACCDTLEEYEAEQRAMTREGLVRNLGDRHTKDDRPSVMHRSQYVLGWSNTEKIAAFEKAAADHLAARSLIDEKIRKHMIQTKLAGRRRIGVAQALTIESYHDIEVATLTARIATLRAEYAGIRDSSNVLKTLQQSEQELKKRIDVLTEVSTKILEERIGREASLKQLGALETECQEAIAAIPEADREQIFAHLVEISRTESPSKRVLTLESAPRYESEWRTWLDARIDAGGAKLNALGSAASVKMGQFRNKWETLVQEFDDTMRSAHHYEALLQRLVADDLPKHEAKFKEALNQNTIREVVGFENGLNRTQKDITDRISTINVALRDIVYSPGTYIRLDMPLVSDPDIQEFRSLLKACTSNSLIAADDDNYSEQRFDIVSKLLLRLRGRPEFLLDDERWRERVTDVRNWFDFSAAECVSDTGQIREYFSDSGGKSGGQKEKLAYTVLAASLACQYGTRDDRGRAFRFVVIDEAFGRGSDESAKYGLTLFKQMGLQLLIATPLQKIQVIEPFVARVGFVENPTGSNSMIRNITIEEHLRNRHERRVGS